MNKNRVRLIFGVILVILLVSVLISGCSFGDLFGGQSSAKLPAPQRSAIITPADQTVIAVGFPVQVLSRHASFKELSRVELWVQKEGQAETQLRADQPGEGTVRQEWIPDSPGVYTLRVKDIDFNNAEKDSPAPVTVRVETAPVGTPSIQPVGTPRPKPGNFSGQVALAGEFNPPAQVGVARVQTVCTGNDAPKIFIEQRGEFVELVADDTEISAKSDKTVLRWQVQGATNVEFDISPPNEEAKTLSSQQALAQQNTGPNNIQMQFPVDKPGEYLITINAVNGTIPCNTSKRVKLQVAPAPTPTFTPSPTPTPTATPYYPPPPPYPGVCCGPTQAELPELRPPVCDAADLLGVYTPPSSNQRIQISEADGIPAKTVGGATVFRAWRLQNTGTCTWGPGYELAFYGGRNMGSGGVAFESTWPGEPGRRNIIADGNRLIVPEGKPNQIAIPEVMLMAPVTPGIHQSYWRMRNPQGVYFGPIMGVTMEVVRECQSGIYGAPTINKFQFLSIGDVFRPVNPIDAQAEKGATVTIEWDVINATSIDIVQVGPTGTSTNVSTGDPNNRYSFQPGTEGKYVITLYADNGPCTVTADLTLDVFPPEDQPFVLAVAAAEDQPTGIDAAWKHADPQATQFTLFAQEYVKDTVWNCSLFGTYNSEAEIPSWVKPFCSPPGWVKNPAGGTLNPGAVAITASDGSVLPQFVNTSGPVTDPDTASIVMVGGTVIQQGVANNTSKYWEGTNQGKLSMSNVLWGLCSAYDDRHKIRLLVQAKRSDGAEPQFPQSNFVDVLCSDVTSASPKTFSPSPGATPVPGQAPIFPPEIPDDSGQ